MTAYDDIVMALNLNVKTRAYMLGVVLFDCVTKQHHRTRGKEAILTRQPIKY